MANNIKKKLPIALLCLLLILQFFQIDKSNPAVDANADFFSTSNAPESVMLSLKHACNDCHSNLTVYPWYSKIQPIGFWLKGHIKNGRRQVNFSEWNSYSMEDKEHAIHECIEVLEEERMPLKSYTWLHPNAKLSDDQVRELIEYFKGL